MKRLFFIFSILAVAGGMWRCTSNKAEEVKLRVHIIGDSTMADYVENTTRTRGWGEMLQEFFTPDVKVINYARGGRSSRSFYKEGRWQWVLDSIQTGDYVLIQFAHNDEKEDGKDGADDRGTAPWTTYKSYLERYVDESRALGATPVFVTPIIRRYFTEDGTISPKGCHDLSTFPDDSTLNYVRVMKRVARDKQVQVVDMTALTKQYAEALGAEKTIKCIYVPTDGTHTQATGAACYARLAVEGLIDQGILSDYLRADIPLVLNPTALHYHTLFAGERGVVCFDLAGINLAPEAGELTLEAPQGMLLADSPDGEPMPKLSFPYEEGKLWNKCFYLHYTPTESGTVEEEVIIRWGKESRRLPVYAEVQEVVERTPLKLTPTEYTLRELVEKPQGVTREGGVWEAEIDEVQKRYVELIIPRAEQTRLLRNISFSIEGEVAFRVACAYGKDFYPRTDLGEEQQAVKGVRKISYPIDVTIHAGQQLHIRLFPWSTTESRNLHFKLSDWQIDGVTLQ
ncbi:MAG: rhamnogalacturonan acetylesterase [Alistipes sp.]|nr:rhamnogalacturonan acetylesterase [Alistipes sp.]